MGGQKGKRKGRERARLSFPGKAGPWPGSHVLPTGSLRVLQKAGATHNPSGLSRAGRRLEPEEALGDCLGKLKGAENRGLGRAGLFNLDCNKNR